jgi:hypothetical protein
MVWPIEEVKVEDLQLDLKNARIREETPKEAAALNYLYASDEVMDLAHSFLRDGYIDNEVPVVVQEGAKFAVLEGNRRVAALKGLTDPNSVPARTKELERLVAKFTTAVVPKAIRVMVAPSRAAAQPLLARLHIGFNKRGWDRDQQAIFFHAQLGAGVSLSDLKDEYPAEASQIQRFIVMGEVLELLRRTDLDDDDLNAFVRSSDFKISSLEYVYRKPAIRALAGLDHDSDGMLKNSTFSAGALRVVRRLIADLKAGILNTRTPRLRTESPEYDEYLAGLAALAGNAPSVTAPAPATGGGEQQQPSGGAGTGTGTTGGSDTGQGDTTSGKKPRAKRGAAATYLDLAGIDYSATSWGLRRRFEELAEIDVTKFPNAAGDHLRSVLECTIKQYFRDLKDPLEAGSTLKESLAKARVHFAKNKHMISVLNNLSQPGQTAAQYSKSAWMLNGINHEPDVFVEGAGVHAAWEHMAPLIKELLTPPSKP